MTELVQIRCKGPISNMAEMTIGGQTIPLYSATIRIKVGEFVTVEAQLPAELVDIEALETNTQVILEESNASL